MATTGADIVFLKLPSLSAGPSFAFAASDLANTMRAGVELASVGPNFIRS